VSCMVVAVSSWPRRSSSAHRICIRPQCPCGAATEATLHTQAGPCSWAAVATQLHPKASPRRVVSQLYAQCRERLRGDTATQFDRTRWGEGRGGLQREQSESATSAVGSGGDRTLAHGHAEIATTLWILRRTKVTRGTRARRVHGYCRLGGEGEFRRPGVEGRQRVRQTGATAYFLICDAGVPAPLFEVCDVSVIRFARPTG